MEVPSVKEPQVKTVVLGGGRWFHCGVPTPWCLTKHHSKTHTHRYSLGMGAGYTGTGVVSPNSPVGGPILHPRNVLLKYMMLLGGALQQNHLEMGGRVEKMRGYALCK
jgi:hypothetical protein